MQKIKVQYITCKAKVRVPLPSFGLPEQPPVVPSLRRLTSQPACMHGAWGPFTPFSLNRPCMISWSLAVILPPR